MKISNKTTMKKVWLGFVTATVLIAAPMTGTAQEKTATAGDYTRGVQRWAENCARCHNTRDTKEFRDDQWKVIVTHMRVRAGLTGQDARDILEFLQRSN